MIGLDFTLVISIYMIVFLGFILAAWLFTKKQRDKDLFLDKRYIWFCSVCTYTYINTREDAISVCPRCGSYNKK